ncbi:hypothetical protein PCANC_02005 [Puccinia coronata f. sp. avenae]|uniref:Uncharacterized protein n=1 Tax=Puccinia coronata f. sp. avenae TaxID=200324 RepID=A0A2N5W1X4_9BASI|nr:hypothetical protein PCANC_02005 [Puccinia coronata f. sp. avenae]
MSKDLEAISGAMHKEGKTPGTQEGAPKGTTAPKARIIPEIGNIRKPHKPRLSAFALEQEKNRKRFGANGESSGKETSKEDRNDSEAGKEASNDSFMDKVIAAERKGDHEGAEMYFAMHKSLGEKEKWKRQPSPPPASDEEEEGTKPLGLRALTRKTTNRKPWIMSQLLGGSTSLLEPSPNTMIWGLPRTSTRTAASYGARIPLTIFNKKWKNAAIIHHAEKRSQLDNLRSDRNRYTGYPYPSKWTQTFSEWTINHRKFYLTMRDVYKFHKFAKWIYKHKRNADEIHAKDGFMVALRYDIQIRANAFAHWVTNPNSSQSVANISVMLPKLQQSCYVTACCFNKLEFGDINPYAEGEARKDWDPANGSKRAKKAATSTGGKTMSTSEGQSSSKGKGVAMANPTPKTSNYKGANYDPNYSNRYRERNSGNRLQKVEGSRSKQTR